ncbi:hypothetical protein IWW43_005329, partial [Coemansia sp. RSA 1935]
MLPFYYHETDGISHIPSSSGPISVLDSVESDDEQEDYLDSDGIEQQQDSPPPIPVNPVTPGPQPMDITPGLNPNMRPSIDPTRGMNA